MFPGGLGVTAELAIVPTGEAFVRADPKAAVARGQQAADPAARQMLAIGRLPGDAAHSIEAFQAEFSAEPEVAVGRLRDRVNRTSEESLADRPSLVSILMDVEGGIQAEGARTGSRGQQEKQGGA
jgi:hypothetical protein